MPDTHTHTHTHCASYSCLNSPWRTLIFCCNKEHTVRSCHLGDTGPPRAGICNHGLAARRLGPGGPFRGRPHAALKFPVAATAEGTAACCPSHVGPWGGIRAKWLLQRGEGAAPIAGHRRTTLLISRCLSAPCLCKCFGIAGLGETGGPLPVPQLMSTLPLCPTLPWGGHKFPYLHSIMRGSPHLFREK